MLTVLGLLALWALWRTCDVLCPWFHRLGDSAQAIVLVVGIYATILVGWQILSMTTHHPTPVRVQEQAPAVSEDAIQAKLATLWAQQRIDAIRARMQGHAQP